MWGGGGVGGLHHYHHHIMGKIYKWNPQRNRRNMQNYAQIVAQAQDQTEEIKCSHGPQTHFFHCPVNTRIDVTLVLPERIAAYNMVSMNYNTQHPQTLSCSQSPSYWSPTTVHNHSHSTTAKYMLCVFVTSQYQASVFCHSGILVLILVNSFLLMFCIFCFFQPALKAAYFQGLNPDILTKLACWDDQAFNTLIDLSI